MSDDYMELMAAAAKASGLKPPALVQPISKYVVLNGIRFHYLDWGNDHLPHVLLLHGGSLTAHTWDMASLLLRDKYHLIALDQRGHGDTDWTPDEALDIENSELMMEDTRQFIEYLGYQHIVLVGMSMGGMNSIRHAARHAKGLDALCIVDVGPEAMREGLVEMEQFRGETETLSAFDDFLDRAVQFLPHRAPEHLRYSLTHSLKQTEDLRWTWKQDHRGRHTHDALVSEDQETQRQIRADALWSDLRGIETPTLLMRGDWSKILSLEHADQIVSTMHDAALVVIPRATHNVHSDNPADFARELTTFLDRVLQ